jgi:hypothetical protein
MTSVGQIFRHLFKIGDATRKSIRVAIARVLWRLSDQLNRYAVALFVRSLH